MRCKKCKIVRKGCVTYVKCWRLWRLCPACAIKKHPEEYGKKQKGIWKESGRGGNYSKLDKNIFTKVYNIQHT